MLAIFLLAGCGNTAPSAPRIFDGKRAYQHVLAQTSLGLRPAGSAALKATGDYVLAQMKQVGWKTETQEFVYRNVPIRNIVAKIGEGRGPVIIVGAHYDTRARGSR